MQKDQVFAYTVEGVIEATGLARSRLYKAIKGGELRTFKAGRRRMISAKAVQDYIANLEKETARAAR